MWRPTDPPIDSRLVVGLPLDQVGDKFEVCPAAAGPTELPQLLGGPMVLVDHIVGGVHVEVLCAVTIDRDRDMLDELGQALLVVGIDPSTRGSALGVRAHSQRD
jgi:hypothetical protein